MTSIKTGYGLYSIVITSIKTGYGIFSVLTTSIKWALFNFYDNRIWAFFAKPTIPFLSFCDYYSSLGAIVCRKPNTTTTTAAAVPSPLSPGRWEHPKKMLRVVSKRLSSIPWRAPASFLARDPLNTSAPPSLPNPVFPSSPSLFPFAVRGPPLSFSFQAPIRFSDLLAFSFVHSLKMLALIIYIVRLNWFFSELVDYVGNLGPWCFFRDPIFFWDWISK